MGRAGRRRARTKTQQISVACTLQHIVFADPRPSRAPHSRRGITARTPRGSSGASSRPACAPPDCKTLGSLKWVPIRWIVNKAARSSCLCSSVALGAGVGMIAPLAGHRLSVHFAILRRAPPSLSCRSCTGMMGQATGSIGARKAADKRTQDVVSAGAKTSITNHGCWTSGTSSTLGITMPSALDKLRDGIRRRQ